MKKVVGILVALVSLTVVTSQARAEESRHFLSLNTDGSVQEFLVADSAAKDELQGEDSGEDVELDEGEDGAADGEDAESAQTPAPQDEVKPDPKSPV